MSSPHRPMPEYSGPMARPTDAQLNQGKRRRDGGLQKRVELSLTDAEREALIKRLGKHRNVAAFVRAVLDQELRKITLPPLPKRKPDLTTRNRLRIRLPEYQFPHLQSEANAMASGDLSDYLIRRLMALPENPGKVPKRTVLTADQRLSLLAVLVVKRFAVLTAAITVSMPTDEVRTALHSFAEIVEHLGLELEEKP